MIISKLCPDDCFLNTAKAPNRFYANKGVFFRLKDALIYVII